MPKIIKKKKKKNGTSVEKARVKITIFDYDETQFQEKEVKTLEECFPFKETPTVTWLNIDGLNPEVIEKICAHFNLHPLVQEDILITDQRPKMEDFEDYLFVILKMFSCEDASNEIRIEQISLILGKNFIISFQEQEGDIFNPIREKIRNTKGRVRKMGTDYLAYLLIDAIIDHYFMIMERLGEDIESIEEKLITEPKPEISQRIHGLKRDMITLRKSVWPLREVLSGLERSESKIMQKSTRVFLRDAYDHTIQVIDTIESFRDMASGMIDIYLSSLSNRMNEVMKVLTIIATIFIPLTFLTGIYGMNFNSQASTFNMPELNWKYGYLALWVIMALVTVSMLIYFKRKRWL